MAIVVQLLSRNNKIIHQQRFAQDEITVGRGYQNDLRLDDPYICAHHMQINRDPLSGALLCQDLESINGTKINHDICTMSNLHDQDIITIGRTHLRIFDADAEVAPTLPLSDFEENIAWLNKKRIALGLTFIVFLFAAYSNFIASFDEIKSSRLVLTTLGQLMLFSIWPLLVAGLSRLNKKESRLASQFSLLWLFLLLMEVFTFLRGVIDFNFPQLPLIAGLDAVFYAVSAFAFIWMTLFVAFHQTLKRRNIISGLMSFLLIFGLYFEDVVEEESFNSRPSYNLPLLPSTYHFLEPMGTEEWINETESLFDKLEQKRLSEESN